MTCPDMPPSTELYALRELAARHPNILTLNRVTWAVRQRHTNGLSRIVFKTRSGEVVIHEPGFIAWYLGLAGRAKPRASSRLKG